jgi:hypothetical protein
VLGIRCCDQIGGFRYARYENPWVSSDFPAADELVITQGNNQLVLDFAAGTRSERVITADTTPLPPTAETTAASPPPPPTSSWSAGSADSDDDSALPTWAIITITVVGILVLAAICVGLVTHGPKALEDSGNETANKSFMPAYSKQSPNEQAWVAPVGAI